jgi:predicted DNA binding protein
MRRLVIEANAQNLSKLIGHSLDEIKSLRVVSILKETRNEMAMICRVDPCSKLKDLVKEDKSFRIQLLECNQQGSGLCYIRRKYLKQTGTYKIGTAPGYLSTPFEIRNGTVKATFLGSPKQVKNFLKNLEESGIPFKTLSLTDAEFSLDSPLDRLTNKQLQVLTAAYNLGYYDIPRRINSDGLAAKLHVRNATVVMHRRRAERRLLGELFGYKTGK